MTLLSDWVSLWLSPAPQSIALGKNCKPWRIRHTQLYRCVSGSLIIEIDCIRKLLLLLHITCLSSSHNGLRAPVCFRFLWWIYVSVVDFFTDKLFQRFSVRFFCNCCTFRIFMIWESRKNFLVSFEHSKWTFLVDPGRFIYFSERWICYHVTFNCLKTFPNFIDLCLCSIHLVTIRSEGHAHWCLIFKHIFCSLNIVYAKPKCRLRYICLSIFACHCFELTSAGRFRISKWRHCLFPESFNFLKSMVKLPCIRPLSDSFAIYSLFLRALLKLLNLVLYPLFAAPRSILYPFPFLLFDGVNLLLLIVVELRVYFGSLLFRHFVLHLLDLQACDLFFFESLSVFEGRLKRAAIFEVVLLTQ